MAGFKPAPTEMKMKLMDVIKLRRGDPNYPHDLTYFDEQSSEVISAVGNLRILRNKLLALFCSIKCPGKIILQTYDLLQHLQQTGVAVVGGFHSPVERECLTILLRGSQPIIICPARSIEGMRIPNTWRLPMNEGRFLILSPFDLKHHRITTELGTKRNEFVAAIADQIFVAHATSGGKTEQFCQKVISWGKTLLTFDCKENTHLIHMGARTIQIEDIVK